MRRMQLASCACGAAWVTGVVLCVAAHTQAPSTSITPATMPRVGAVDERFQSYNIEAVEITGGRFWKPYASVTAADAGTQPTTPSSGGINPSLLEYRPPIDLNSPRLRKLAAALGPAYLRVSGTWMNSTYFQDSDEPAPLKPPTGFNSVLTRKEWKGVIDFARAVDAEIMTSFAISAGTRDAAGVWTPKVAQAFMSYTKMAGGSIAAAEFINEPNFPEVGGAPKGYDGQAYARDFAVFQVLGDGERSRDADSGNRGCERRKHDGTADDARAEERRHIKGHGACVRYLHRTTLTEPSQAAAPWVLRLELR